MKTKKYIRTALDITSAGIVTGVGASALTSAGSTKGAAALNTFSSYLSPMASVSGLGLMTDSIRELTPKRKKGRML